MLIMHDSKNDLYLSIPTSFYLALHEARVLDSADYADGSRKRLYLLNHLGQEEIVLQDQNGDLYIARSDDAKEVRTLRSLAHQKQWLELEDCGWEKLPIHVEREPQ